MIRKAEMNPAKSITSTKTKSSMPNTPFDTSFSARCGLGRNGMIDARAAISTFPFSAFGLPRASPCPDLCGTSSPSAPS